jgi:hypothetical protein
MTADSKKHIAFFIFVVINSFVITSMGWPTWLWVTVAGVNGYFASAIIDKIIK